MSVNVGLMSVSVGLIRHLGSSTGRCTGAEVNEDLQTSQNIQTWNNETGGGGGEVGVQGGGECRIINAGVAGYG